MIATFFLGLFYYVDKTDPITAIRLAWYHADEPGMSDWLTVILLYFFMLGLAEVSRG